MTEEKKNRKNPKQFSGVVVGDKMQKTVKVLVERIIKHTAFKKQVRRHKKFLAHDEDKTCKLGDKVVIEETRPLSKLKRWRVVEIVEKAK
jgi:small subunit ribosomal protein S17